MKTIRDKVSYFYVGEAENVRDYLMLKIGETTQTCKKRAKDIRAKGYRNFQMLGCLKLKNVTKAERRLIESDVRVRMEKYGKNIKNDFFMVKAKAKKYQNLQYIAFALVALEYAVACCKREGFKYEVKFF